MAYNIGLNVVEIDGKGSPAIQGAATSVAGFNILTRRGIPNRPTRVTSFNQFADQFGSYFANGLGAYLVKGFFDNGGVTAYINRVVANDALTGAATARIAIQDVTPGDVIRVEAGYRGLPDPGTWANNLFVRVGISATPVARIRETQPASVDTAGLAATSNMAGAAPLSVTVDGDATATSIAFQASDFASAAAATPAEIRDAINRRTTRVVVPRFPVGDEVSRFSRMQFLDMLGVSDYVGSLTDWPPLACLCLTFPYVHRVGIPVGISRSSIHSPPMPLSTLRPAPRDAHRRTQGQDGSLLLSRQDSFIPYCMPVYPGARTFLLCLDKSESRFDRMRTLLFK